MRKLLHQMSAKLDQLFADMFPRLGDEEGYGNF